MDHSESSTRILIQMLLRLREEFARTSEENQRLRALLAARSNSGGDGELTDTPSVAGEETPSPHPGTTQERIDG